MKQDIIPYSQLRYRRIRSQRPVVTRTVSVVSVRRPVAQPVEIIEVDTYVFEPTPMTRPIESLSSEEKIAALERALQNARLEWKRERRRNRGLRRFLVQ